MKKSAIDKATAILRERYTAWEQDPQRFSSGYEYESSFAKMMEAVEREVFALSVGDAPKDRNRKKNSTPASGK